MIIEGDATALPLPDNSVHAIVCDPPYGLPGGFMGKTWDKHDGRENVGFAYWLTGLIDGEGHFGIKAQRGSDANTTHIPFFALKMRADERATLEGIVKELRIGQLQDEQRTAGNPMVRWVVQTKADCQRLVDVIDKYGLRAKKRMDYAVWRQAVCEWTNRPRGNRWHGAADDTRMRELKRRMETVRTFVDPPWSGHEYQDWCRIWAAEALRVAIPGAHLLAFGGTRTFHRLAVAIEDAGWEIRDSIGLLGWCYGQGFPKSLDIGKAIDKAAGAERQVIGAGAYANRGRRTDNRVWGTSTESASEVVTTPATADAERWQGWGTALKPAWEPVIVARKPFAGTVAGNVLANGVGGINVDGCRISTGDDLARVNGGREVLSWGGTYGSGPNRAAQARESGTEPPGRWPTNLLLTHHPDCADECQPECHVRAMDEQSGVRPGMTDQHDFVSNVDGSQVYGGNIGKIPTGFRVGLNDTGTASRFFPVFRYNAKASTAERPRLSTPDGKPIMHPTVKPVALLRWLVKLVTPPGGTVLDQFAGTGSTLAAAEAEGFASIGVELDHDYCRLAQQRLATPPTVDRPKRKRVTKPAPAAKPVTVWTVDEARAMRTAGYSVEHITRVTGHTLTPVVPST